jgi:hypothetical protein
MLKILPANNIVLLFKKKEIHAQGWEVPTIQYTICLAVIHTDLLTAYQLSYSMSISIMIIACLLTAQ